MENGERYKETELFWWKFKKIGDFDFSKILDVFPIQFPSLFGDFQILNWIFDGFSNFGGHMMGANINFHNELETIGRP